MKCSALNVDFNSVRFDPLGSRSPPYERIKFGYPLEKVRFLLLSTNLAREWLQTDTYLLPTTYKHCRRAFHWFHCAKTIEDRPGQPAYEMFGIKRRFQRCTVIRCDPLGLMRPPHERIKFGYPLENVRFLLLSTNLAREWLQIDTDLLRIITSTADATAYTERVNFR